MPARLLAALDLLLLPGCAACWDTARPGPGPPLCPACAAAWPGPTAAVPVPGLDTLHALWPYAGPVQPVVRRAKAAPRGPEARFLAKELRRRVQEAGLCPGAVVAVPARRVRRGRHLAAALARELRRGTGWPAGPRLRRRVERPAQASLDGAARRRNLTGSFALARRLPGPLPARVWVVDDVATTGATLREAARVLRAAGVAAVAGLVLARVPGPAA